MLEEKSYESAALLAGGSQSIHTRDEPTSNVTLARLSRNSFHLCRTMSISSSEDRSDLRYLISCSRLSASLKYSTTWRKGLSHSFTTERRPVMTCVFSVVRIAFTAVSPSGTDLLALQTTNRPRISQVSPLVGAAENCWSAGVISRPNFTISS